VKSSPGPKEFTPYFESRKLDAHIMMDALMGRTAGKLLVELYQLAGEHRVLPVLRGIGRAGPEQEAIFAQRRTRATLAYYALGKMDESLKACNTRKAVNLFISSATSLDGMLCDGYFSKPLRQIADEYAAAYGSLSALSAETGVEILEADMAIKRYAPVIGYKLSDMVGFYEGAQSYKNR
jgi:hypothetical protein